MKNNDRINHKFLSGVNHRYDTIRWNWIGQIIIFLCVSVNFRQKNVSKSQIVLSKSTRFFGTMSALRITIFSGSTQGGALPNVINDCKRMIFPLSRFIYHLKTIDNEVVNQ